MADPVARMEEGRNTFNILVGTLTGKIPLGRPRSRWEDNIRMDLKEISINTRNWFNLVQDKGCWRALVNLRVPQVMELTSQLIR